MTEKRPMVILTGPTAVGKTALSIELAKKINGSIISADSMQVYRHMDIGSAKVMPEEMNGVKHYLIDEFEPDEEFHVVKFVERAKEHLEEIYAEGKIPIIAGGTGFYIQALLYDIDFTEQECDEAYRAELEQLAAEKGADYLHNMLREVDPASADAIHANNIKRVIRALEFYHLSGRRISEPCSSTTLRTPPLMSLTSNTATSSGRILWRGWFLRSMLMISPVGVTMRHESRLSSVVPYSKANGPPEFSATFPPMVEAVFEAGSTVKRNPSFATASMAACVITPASSVTLMFS